MTLSRPEPGECAEYYSRYIDLVPDGSITGIMEDQLQQTLKLLGGVDEEKAGFRYQPGKWSLKEVVGHVVDIERVFAYRALCFSRNDKSPIPGVEQDEYVKHAGFDRRTLESLVSEFRGLRKSNIVLFESFDEDVPMRRGTASDVEFTVRSIPYIIAGHELHHVSVLKDRYL